MTGRFSCLSANSQDDNPDVLFLSLPSDVPLTRRIWQEVREVFNPKHDEPLPMKEELDSRFGFLVTATEKSLPARLFKEAQFAAGRIARAPRTWVKSNSLKAGAISQESYTDLAFLREIDIAPFHVRLVHAALETIASIISNPMAFINGTVWGRTVSKDRKKLLVTGVSAAIMVYAAALSTVYASHIISRRNDNKVETRKQIEVVKLLPLPAFAVKTMQAKQLGGGGNKNQLTAPKQLVRQQKPEAVAFRPAPRPLDQIQSKPEPQTEITKIAAAPDPSGDPIASPTASSGGSGAGSSGSSGTVYGAGVGSGNGPGASIEGPHYDDVFSVASVTVRPQILGRPTPDYTDEARRGQIEGSVKLSVVLKADSTVSDIRVVRGLGYGLDEKAIEAARQLRFLPAQKDGSAVSVRVILEFKFSLV